MQTGRNLRLQPTDLLVAGLVSLSACRGIPYILNRSSSGVEKDGHGLVERDAVFRRVGFGLPRGSWEAPALLSKPAFPAAFSRINALDSADPL